jgi:hypothetical protein
MANIRNPDEQFQLRNKSGDRYIVNVKDKGSKIHFELCDKNQRHEHTAKVRSSKVTNYEKKAQEVVNTHS